MKYFLFFTLLIISTMTKAQQPLSKKEPLKVGIVGLVHTHVHWILGREQLGDIEIVGIAESNTELATAYAKQHGFSMKIVYPSISEMLKFAKPEVVTDFGTIRGHLETVKQCAPKGIHVMVEKPLAVSLKDAREMASLARENKIFLLTNYESTWYPTTYKSTEIVENNDLGALRKIVVNDGHPGPKEIGVNQEFLDWLIDPVENGGGAITDFGCYGANLITRLMKNERPESVFSVTQQIKPDIYPEVDDEATIVLTYPKMQGIIQASWNWPFHRKDMTIYGTEGYVRTVDGPTMYTRIGKETAETKVTLEAMKYPENDPFAYFKAVYDGRITPDNDLSSLSNNLIVMEILEAAKESALTGKRVYLSKPGGGK